MRKMTIWAALVVALSVACSEPATAPHRSTYAVAYDELPEGCNTEPYSGELSEGGEPIEDPGPNRGWYQGSDGRWYNCPKDIG